MVQQIIGQPTIKRWRLYFAVIVVNLLFISTGCVLTWSSPVLPKLRLPEEVGSWISSISSLGGAFGPIFNSLASPYVGRKIILLANGIMFLASWIVLITWTNLVAMIIGRFIGGMAVGLSFISVAIYLTEAADLKVRQAVTSLTEFFIGIGYLITYGMGPYLTYFQLQVWSSGAIVLFFIPFLFLPESPHYFISKGERVKAAESLAWFRGLKYDQVESELDEIQDCFTFRKAEADKSSKLDILKKKEYRNAFLLGYTLLTIHNLSGIGVMTSYTEPILSSAGLPFPASTGAVLFGSVNIFSAAFAPPIVKRFGTKTVLIYSNIIIALSLYVYSGYMYCQVHGIDVHVINILPVICLVVYNISFCVGGGPLPWSLLAELSAPEFHAFNSSVISMLSWTGSFFLTRSWAPARQAFGDWVIFGFFAVCETAGVIFIVFCLPDTRALSLADVQKLLAGGSKREEKDNEHNERRIQIEVISR